MSFRSSTQTHYTSHTLTTHTMHPLHPPHTHSLMITTHYTHHTLSTHTTNTIHYTHSLHLPSPGRLCSEGEETDMSLISVTGLAGPNSTISIAKVCPGPMLLKSDEIVKIVFPSRLLKKRVFDP